MSETLTVDGDENLSRTLHVAAADIENLSQIENARLVQQRAQAAAPKVSGQLGQSVWAKDLGKGTAVVGSDLIYAPVINNGWAGHNIRAQPFLTEAAANSAPLVQAHSLRQVNRALSKVKGA